MVKWMRGLSLREKTGSVREVLGCKDRGISAQLSTDRLSTSLKSLQLLYRSGVLLA